MKKLRDYQQATIDSSNTLLSEGHNEQLFEIATGLGKTFIAVKLMQQYSGRKLWLTHREELIEQSALAILKEEEWLKEHHLEALEDGVINAMRAKSGLFDNNVNADLQNHIGIVKQDLMQVNGAITVASIQTIVRRLDQIPQNHYDLLIVDEAHLAKSKTFTKVIDHFKTKLRIGLTATPYRLDGASLKDIFPTTAANYDIKYGIDNNYLCELEAYRIKTELSLDEIKSLGGDLNIGQLDKVIDTPVRNRKVVNAYLQYAKDRPAIMFCNTVQHAINLSKMFNESGIPSTFVVGDEELCPNRKERISLYASGEIKVVTSVDIMTTGVDIPQTACVGMVRPTKSRTLYLQSLGRGTRLKPDWSPYKNCVILDIVDNSTKHSLINTETLDAHKKLEDKIFLTKEKKAALIISRNAKLKHDLKSDEKVNLLPLPQIKLDFTKDMKRAPSVAQIETLKKFGYNVQEDNFTMGHAYELIANSPASVAQVEGLRKWKYDVSKGVTVAQAQKAYADIALRTQHKKVVVNHPFIGLT